MKAKKQICYPVKQKLITNNNTCSIQWELLQRFGEEANYGEVWIACCRKDCDYVLKYMSYENNNKKEDIINEVNIQDECSALGLCPKIADAWLCEEGGAIVMEKFQITVANLLLEYKSGNVKQLILANILSLIDRLHLHGIYHGDLHLNNIMVKINKNVDNTDISDKEHYILSNYQYYLIDFGKGGKFKDYSDGHVYKDYYEIYSHIEDLKDDYPEDEELKNLWEIMQIHMKKFD